jgi:hypothetical protein
VVVHTVSAGTEPAYPLRGSHVFDSALLVVHAPPQALAAQRSAGSSLALKTRHACAGWHLTCGRRAGQVTSSGQAGGGLVAALGALWAHAVNTRLVLETAGAARYARVGPAAGGRRPTVTHVQLCVCLLAGASHRVRCLDHGRRVRAAAAGAARLDAAHAHAPPCTPCNPCTYVALAVFAACLRFQQH